MILSGRTKVRTGRIAGMLLLLVAIAVLPLAAVARSDDKSDKRSFDERLRRLAQSNNEKRFPPEPDAIAKSARNTEGQQEAAKSVVAYWRFQEGISGSVAGGSPLIPGSVVTSTENRASRSPSSSLIEDSSGNGRHGRAVGGPKYRSVNLPGSNLALAFDGHDDRVVVPDAPIFHLTRSFTLEAYIEIGRSPRRAAELSQIVFRGDSRPSFDPTMRLFQQSRTSGLQGLADCLTVDQLPVEPGHEDACGLHVYGMGHGHHAAHTRFNKTRGNGAKYVRLSGLTAAASIQ